ncbi:MAG: hypothetical protein RL317_102 [Pseudomonadota bacterium]
MLAFFRRALSSWAVIGLLGLLMMAFIVTGIGTPSSMGALGGLGSSEVVRVGTQTLTTNDLSQRLELELRQAREQQPELTMAQLLQGGTLEQMVSQMTNLLSLRAFGEEHGMSVSDKLGDAEIASIPAFQGAAGKFDEGRYRQALSGRGITEEQFRADIDQSIAVQQLLVPVAASAGAPRDLALPFATLLVERRLGSVAEFRNSSFTAGPAPTDAQLQQFYQANLARYTVPQQRVLRYAIVDKAMVAKSAAPSEADIRAQYEKDAAKYATKEQRDLTQIIVQDQKAAAALAQKVRSGTSMADAAKAAGVDAVPIANADKAQLTSQASAEIANAAFGASKGSVIGPMKSTFGWYVVRVDAVRTLGGKTLDQARAEISKALADQKSADAFSDLLAKIDEQVADGATFDDVLKANGLKAVTTPPLTAEGTALSQPGFKLDPSFAPVLKDAFQAEANDDPALVPLGADKDVFYALDRIIAAAPRPLADIRARVTADFIAERASKSARRAAELALGKANAGAGLAGSGGTVRSLSARRADFLKAQIAPSPDVQQLFDLRVGKARLVPSADRQGWVVVKLERIEPGNLAEDPSLIAAMQSQLSNAIGREYTEQFATAVKKEMKVKRNEEAIRGLRKNLAGAGSAAR